MDVVKLVGFSKTTVSRVINGYGPVSEEARLKIEEAMRKLNYTPNHFTQGMRTNKTRTIALLVPDCLNPFYPELFKSVEEVARYNHFM
ncbi:MAG: LacI family transcriptional regulator [Halanaerobiales bacterium]|nr:LacI family transcriptional regulator [Halanaerobiales bacterium]